MRLLFQLCLQGDESHCKMAVMSPYSARLHPEPPLLPWACPQPRSHRGSFVLEGALDFTVCICPSCSAGVWESFSEPFSPASPPVKLNCVTVSTGTELSFPFWHLVLSFGFRRKTKSVDNTAVSLAVAEQCCTEPAGVSASQLVIVSCGEGLRGHQELRGHRTGTACGNLSMGSVACAGQRPLSYVLTAFYTPATAPWIREYLHLAQVAAELLYSSQGVLDIKALYFHVVPPQCTPSQGWATTSSLQALLCK